jgi:hypothetical protein
MVSESEPKDKKDAMLAGAVVVLSPRRWTILQPLSPRTPQRDPYLSPPCRST